MQIRPNNRQNLAPLNLASFSYSSQKKKNTLVNLYCKVFLEFSYNKGNLQVSKIASNTLLYSNNITLVN